MHHRIVHVALALATTALPLLAGAQTVVYASGFEPPGFNVGPVGDAYLQPDSGQDGWQASPREPYASAPSPWVAISPQRAYGGTQSLQLRMDTSFYNGVNGYGASAWRNFSSTPLALNSTTDAFSVSMRLYLDQASSSDLGWSMSLYTSVTGVGVRLTPDNKLVYGHNLMNQAVSFAPGFDLHNTWLQLTLETDPTDWTTLRLSVSNGAQSWQQQVSSPGGAMNYFAFGGAIPTFPVAAFGTAYVDDLRIGYNLAAVPEPGSGALWLAGLGTVLLWRRRAAAVAP
jgi:MYXO-CTERM domain-containing protein